MEFVVAIILLVFVVFCIVMVIKTSNIKKKHKKAVKELKSQRLNNISDFPNCMNDNEDTPGDALVFDKKGHCLGRVDGKPLNDADVDYLVRKGYEDVKIKREDMQSRGFIGKIITDTELNDNEIIFFDIFAQKLLAEQLNPGYISLDRLGSGALNVKYMGMYIGKIFLAEKDVICKYRVIKNGNTRATKVFENNVSAENYIQNKVGYRIEEQQTKVSSWMQCLIGDYRTKDLDDVNINSAIEAIPTWIKYIKHCVRSYRRAVSV